MFTSEATTRGIRVAVVSEYAPGRSRPQEQRRPAVVPGRTVGHPVAPIVIDRLVKAYNGVVAVRTLTAAQGNGHAPSCAGRRRGR